MHASVVKLVDTTDSKSVALKSVSVRVRPLVPFESPKGFENTRKPLKRIALRVFVFTFLSSKII